MKAAPPGYSFATKGDATTRCPHRPTDVGVQGNVDRLKIWVCRACRLEVVPVAPGWRWNHRLRRHEHVRTADVRRAELGHAYAYMDKS